MIYTDLKYRYMQVDADLTPVSDSEVNVQFTKFKIFGLIPVTAPPSAKGSLSVSFLDDELRISRGDKGNESSAACSASYFAPCGGLSLTPTYP